MQTVLALVFLCVVLASYAVMDLVFSEDRSVRRRLQELTRYEREQARAAQPMLQPFSQRIVAPALDRLGQGVHNLWPGAYRARLAVSLVRAGSPHGLTVARLIVGKIGLTLGVSGLVIAFAMIGGAGVGSTIFALIVLGLLTYYAPDFWLDAKVKSRQSAIVRGLPDMLDMLTISVEAGLGFDAALAKLVQSTTGPLAEEFGRVLQQVQAGASRKEALRAMAERVEVQELSSFTTSLVQADIFGISISKVLRTQASELRLRRRQRAEEEAQKAPVKIVVPLVLCILPATLIVVAGPAVVRIVGMFGS